MSKENIPCVSEFDSLQERYYTVCGEKQELKDEIERLKKCLQEIVNWFDRINRYQKQRLGHGLKEAEQCWAEATDIEMFDFTKAKELLKK